MKFLLQALEVEKHPVFETQYFQKEQSDFLPLEAQTQNYSWEKYELLSAVGLMHLPALTLCNQELHLRRHHPQQEKHSEARALVIVDNLDNFLRQQLLGQFVHWKNRMKIIFNST